MIESRSGEKAWFSFFSIVSCMDIAASFHHMCFARHKRHQSDRPDRKSAVRSIVRQMSILVSRAEHPIIGTNEALFEIFRENSRAPGPGSRAEVARTALPVGRLRRGR